VKRFTQLDVDLYHARQSRAKPSVHKPEAKEADLHSKILTECWRRGWPVVHARMDRPATVQIGTPDFVIACPNGRTLWIEAKAGNRKPTTDQLAWIASLKRQGHRACVVRSIEEFVELL